MPQLAAAAQTNEIDGRRDDPATPTEEDGRSPVEEAGREAQEPDVVATVEEGEEAALALDASPSQLRLIYNI